MRGRIVWPFSRDRTEAHAMSLLKSFLSGAFFRIRRLFGLRPKHFLDFTMPGAVVILSDRAKLRGAEREQAAEGTGSADAPIDPPSTRRESRRFGPRRKESTHNP